MPEKNIVFFIGTTAEYIKLFPVIEQAKKNNVPFKIIASGQNEISLTDIAAATGLETDIQLSTEEDIVKNVFGLFFWFFKTMFSSKKRIKNALDDVDFKNSVMVVHGDTLSTVMGGVLAKKLKMKLAHVEAGLRSHHLFQPFPEEIDRLVVSKLADYNYCQGEAAASNLKKSRGEVINTKHNTIVDATEYAMNTQTDNSLVTDLTGTKYGVFVIHRQENLLRKQLVVNIVSKAVEISKKHTIVFVLHQITENTLKSYGLYETLSAQDNIILTRRMDYFDFVKLLKSSEFVITDGGSNQEELSYLGKPTLVLRTATERNEGLGKNVLLYNGDYEQIIAFAEHHEDYKTEPVKADQSPAQLICGHLISILQSRN